MTKRRVPRTIGDKILYVTVSIGLKCKDRGMYNEVAIGDVTIVFDT